MILAALIAYPVFIRPLLTDSGGPTALEAYPATQWVGDPVHSYIQSRTYRATPEQIWPWLVQLGYQRAGWYNMDWINGLVPGYFYEGSGSAWRIIPELQDLSLGDSIAIAPGFELPVIQLEANRSLTMGVEISQGDPDNPFAPGTKIGWGYYLEPVSGSETRLVAVYATDYPVTLGSYLMIEVFSIIGGGMIQQPAMLHGIALRVEQ